MDLQIKRLSEQSVTPNRAHHNDAGLDLYATEDIKIPGLIGLLIHILEDIISELPDGHYNYIDEKIKDLRECIKPIGTGVAIALPEQTVGLIWDKSGLGSRGIKVLGGVIDEGYRGEIVTCLINLGVNDFTIKPGTKIAQLIVQPVNYVQVINTDSLNETERGDSGFGSTGV